MSDLYWKVEYEVPGGERWSIDNWVFPRSEAAVRPSTALIRAVIDEDGDVRDAILAIKEAAVERGKRAHGRWVYEAVLDAGVCSYPEYVAWLGDRDVWERSEWTPSR